MSSRWAPSTSTFAEFQFTLTLLATDGDRSGAPAGVAPTGEKRTFHSLRHTFARVAVENNRPIFWLSKHLGHSSLDVTSNVYGHFEKATRRREAEAMAGVFGV